MATFEKESVQCSTMKSNKNIAVRWEALRERRD